MPDSFNMDYEVIRLRVSSDKDVGWGYAVDGWCFKYKYTRNDDSLVMYCCDHGCKAKGYIIGSKFFHREDAPWHNHEKPNLAKFVIKEKCRKIMAEVQNVGRPVQSLVEHIRTDTITSTGLQGFAELEFSSTIPASASIAAGKLNFQKILYLCPFSLLFFI